MQPIVLSHGLGDDAGTWAEVLPVLAARHQVVTWDLRGHGSADRPIAAGDFTSESAIVDLLNVIDEAGPPVHLVGHSLGGFLSMVVALRRPDLVRSLTLIASGPGYRDPSAREAWNRFVDRAVLRMPVPAAAAGLAHQESSEVIDGVALLQPPLLVIVGERDTRFHAGTSYLERTVPGCAVHRIAGAGHFPQRTHASEVAALVLDHVNAADDDDYEAAKREYLEALERDVRRVNVVYAAGKTGTTALATALKRAGLAPVFQIHNLGVRASEAREREYRAGAPGVRPVHIWEALWLASHPPTVERRWKIVTSVRDPVARLVAQWFQEDARFGSGPVPAGEVVDELVARSKRLDKDWFDFQFGTLLGINVYEHPFDPATGYGLIETPAADVLLVRQESLERAASPLGKFFELSGSVDLRRENVGADKDYASLYRDVLAQVRLPGEMVDSVYSTRFARHFYSDTELEAFRRRWTLSPRPRES